MLGNDTAAARMGYLDRLLARLFPLVAAWTLIATSSGFAEFNPPRIVNIFMPRDAHSLGDSLVGMRMYHIDQGTRDNVETGNRLSVYREKVIVIGSGQTFTRRIFIGSMTIEKAQPEYSIGSFVPNPNLSANPEIRLKTAIREDIVIPRFTLDASLLFTKGGAELKAEAKQSMQGIVEFISMFTPSKVVIEGHTDSDGNDADNLELSEERANSMRSFLVDTYEFISPGMVDAVGFGEQRPMVENDTEENKAMNRRVEIVIWE